MSFIGIIQFFVLFFPKYPPVPRQGPSYDPIKHLNSFLEKRSDFTCFSLVSDGRTQTRYTSVPNGTRLTLYTRLTSPDLGDGSNTDPLTSRHQPLGWSSSKPLRRQEIPSSVIYRVCGLQAASPFLFRSIRWMDGKTRLSVRTKELRNHILDVQMIEVGIMNEVP